jgi:diacylglycerol kinase family enzyme
MDGPAAQRDWVGIAANAASGVGSGRERVDRLIRALETLGMHATVAWSPEGRQQLVAEAATNPRSRCLVAAGGDGTVAALVNEQPTVPITVLSAGTENLFAGHFGLTGSPEELAQTIAAGRVVPIDLGLVGERRFALMAGVGFDADVVTRHHRARVGRAGRMRPTHRGAYVEPVLRSSWSYQFPRLTVCLEGEDGREETLTGTIAFVFNLPRYALGLPIAPQARASDGWLDLVLFHRAGPFRALLYLVMVVFGLHRNRPDIDHRRVRRVEIRSIQTVPVQLDGDPGGVLAGGAPPWTAQVLPQALKVVVPASYVAG